ncbi:MAG: hypothetical protein ACTSRU_20840 [Candidatus Hodarchaeales archaeon]
MKLICLSCGNRRYFEAEVETFKEISVNSDSVVVENAVFDDWDQTEITIRTNLEDTINFVLKQGSSILKFDSNTGYYYNTYIFCALCNSARVTPPYSDWTPPNNKTLDEELFKNRKEYHQIRKEKISHENNLPVLWEPKEFSDSAMGSMHI